MSDRERVEVVGYRPSMRDGLVDLWNELFRDRRNFQPMTRELWRERIEMANAGEAFEPELLRVATIDHAAIGFVHGGVWEGPFLDALVPKNDPERGGFAAMGHLSLIGVAESHRRRGVGTELIDSLREAIGRLREPGIPLVVDGRVFNPFYGNFFAPRAPLWGTPEGVAVPVDDVASNRFLERLGFRVDQRAISVVANPEKTREAPRQAYEPEIDVEIVEHDDYQAILGSQGGSAFPYSNRSRSWVAVQPEIQVGSLIAFPFDESGASSTRWGIHSLEVEPEYRGRGVARRLLVRAFQSWRASGAHEIEALVLPEESPGARHLYESLGFLDEAEWLIYT